MLLISSDISKVSCLKPQEKVEQCIVTAVHIAASIYCMTKKKVHHIITEDVLLTTFINIYASMYMIMVKVPCKFKFKNPPFYIYNTSIFINITFQKSHLYFQYPLYIFWKFLLNIKRMLISPLRWKTHINIYITRMSFQVGLIEISIHGRSHEQAFVPERGPYVSATSAISSACLQVQCICLGQILFVISVSKPKS